MHYMLQGRGHQQHATMTCTTPFTYYTFFHGLCIFVLAILPCLAAGRVIHLLSIILALPSLSLYSYSFVNPRHACAARLTAVVSMCLSVCVSVNQCLTSRASFRPENDITYSTGTKVTQNIVWISLKLLRCRYIASCIVWQSCSRPFWKLRMHIISISIVCAFSRTPAHVAPKVLHFSAFILLVNPRHACAARVTVLGLCVSVCVCVCVCVCLCVHADDYSRAPGYKRTIERYQQPQHYKGSKNNVAILLKRWCSGDMA